MSRRPRPNSWLRLARLAAEGRREGRMLSVATALAVAAAAAAAALMMISGYLITRAWQRPAVLSLMVAIVAIRALALLRALARYGERLAAHDAALRLIAALRLRLYRRLAPLVPAVLTGASGRPGERPGERAGELLARFAGDVETLQDLYLRALTPPIVALATVVLGAFAAWLLLPEAGVALFASLLAAALAIPAAALLAGRIAAAGSAQARTELTAGLLEVIDGAPELVLAGRAAERLDHLRGVDRRLQRLAAREALAAAAAAGLASITRGIALIAVLVVAIPAVDEGRLSKLMLAALALLVLALFEAFEPLLEGARRLEACRVAADRVEGVCERSPDVRDPAAPSLWTPPPPSPPSPVPGSSRESRRQAPRREVALDEVWFRYEEGAEWLLRGVSMKLRTGEMVALTGASGTGKSTIAELLVRFRDPLRGRVLLDGADVRDMTQEQLRSAVLLCGQDAHIFNTTIRENLLLANRAAGERELFSALELACIGDWVRSLPRGLDERLGRLGCALSGGQRRRLALARALLSTAPLLLLDEPLTHLDAEVAERLMANLRQVAARRGILLITHQSAHLELCDRVLELKASACAASFAHAGDDARSCL